MIKPKAAQSRPNRVLLDELTGGQYVMNQS